MAVHKRPTIADRENQYKAQHRRKQVISPERVDPFADGRWIYKVVILLLIIRFQRKLQYESINKWLSSLIFE